MDHFQPRCSYKVCSYREKSRIEHGFEINIRGLAEDIYRKIHALSHLDNTTLTWEVHECLDFLGHYLGLSLIIKCLPPVYTSKLIDRWERLGWENVGSPDSHMSRVYRHYKRNIQRILQRILRSTVIIILKLNFFPLPYQTLISFQSKPLSMLNEINDTIF